MNPVEYKTCLDWEEYHPPKNSNKHWILMTSCLWRSLPPKREILLSSPVIWKQLRRRLRAVETHSFGDQGLLLRLLLLLATLTSPTRIYSPCSRYTHVSSHPLLFFLTLLCLIALQCMMHCNEYLLNRVGRHAQSLLVANRFTQDVSGCFWSPTCSLQCHTK